MSVDSVVRHSAWADCRLKALSDADCRELAASGARELALSGNAFTSLPPLFGASLAFLARLDLSRNRLAALPPPLLSLSALTSLSLRANTLTSLPPLAPSLPLLETLDLGENELSPDALASLAGMSNLETLQLDSNGLSGASLAGLPCLLSLDLRKNRLTKFPQLTELASLTDLTLRSNHLRSLPSSGLHEVATLVRLDLGDNQLSAQDLVLTGLKYLREIDLSYNRLTHVPHFEPCDKLESLRLSNNLIASFSASFNRAFSSLRSLDVSHNRISEVPQHVVELTCVALEELLLAHNVLEHIPPLPTNDASFRLRRLDFKWNKVTFADVEHLIELEFAGRLHLSHFYETVPQLLLPGVYLGSAEAARNVHAVMKLGITHILNTATDRNRHLPDSFRFMTLGLEDIPGQNVLAMVQPAHAFIEQALKENGAVLVHCQEGKSRSVTIAATYLMKVNKIDAQEALKFIQAKRPSAKPIQYFVEQMMLYEQQLRENLAE